MSANDTPQWPPREMAAFPVAVPEMWHYVHPGMSLRDWFAGQALAALVNNGPIMLAADRVSGGKPRKHLVECAYALADEMLTTRQNGEDQ